MLFVSDDVFKKVTKSIKVVYIDTHVVYWN